MLSKEVPETLPGRPFSKIIFSNFWTAFRALEADDEEITTCDARDRRDTLAAAKPRPDEPPTTAIVFPSRVDMMRTV